MDREIPKEVRQKERNKKIIRYSAIGVAGVIVVSVLISLMRVGVEEKDLVFSTVDKGVIEVSVSASGKVVPAFEEIINSPINSRILEIYKKGGDSVEIGTPILKLDLQSTETQYQKLLDEEQMRRYKLDQLRVNSQTKLSDMAMQIKVSAMKLSRMKVELRNEHYLDSLGAGTTDKVRQAELSYNVAQLEYEQLQQQFKNEQEVAAAELKVQELDFNIFRKSLAEMKRTFEDAQIRSPRKAILTFINNQIGAQISQGEQVAVISDLSHFKVEGEIADTYGDRVSAGGKAIVKIGSDKLEGTVSSVTPLSKNGVISFSVQLKEDNHRRLRSGLPLIIISSTYSRLPHTIPACRWSVSAHRWLLRKLPNPPASVCHLQIPCLYHCRRKHSGRPASSCKETLQAVWLHFPVHVPSRPYRRCGQ